MSRIVAIIGTAPNSRHMANQQPPEVEIWALNDCWSFIQRPWNVWFEIHGKSMRLADGPEHDEFLKTGQSPVQEKCFAAPGARVMMLGGTKYEAPHADIPMAVPYPFEEIEAVLGNANNPEGEPYLRSTIDYMIAQAILEGVDEIRVYGINLATTTEYANQRPSAEYWLGVAHGRGIKLTIPADCTLLNGDMYGPKRKGVITSVRLDTRKQRLEYQAQINDQEYQSANGAVQALQHVREEFAKVGARLPNGYGAVLNESEAQAMAARHAAEMQIQAVNGALQENTNMRGLANEPVDLDSPMPHLKEPIAASNGYHKDEAPVAVGVN